MKNQDLDETIDIRKLFYLLLSKWIWFVGTVFVSIVVASLYLAMTPKKYLRTEKVLFVESQKNDQSGMDKQLSEYISIGSLQGSNNINDKILTLQDPMIMQEVVRLLGLETSYQLRRPLKDKEFYKNSPIDFSFGDKSLMLPIEISLELLNENEFNIEEIKQFDSNTNEYISFDEGYKGQFGDTIHTAIGSLLINKTSYYKADYDNKQIIVSSCPIPMISTHYSANLGIQKINKEANVIQISMTDTSIKRADDILKTLITVYNTNWLKDKNRIAVSTSEFINSRLAIIEKELTSVDHDINLFKSKNNVSDIDEAGKEYMRQSNESEQRIFEMNTRLSLARYIRKSLDVSKDDYHMIPVNTGLESNVVERQITSYNDLLIKRNNLLYNSSKKNPLILQINHNLEALRNNLILNLDELIYSINLFITKQESNTTQRGNNLTSNNPEKVSFLLSAERRQKVKESLYLFLLHKREQNELSKIFVAYSTKVIDPPHGSLSPINPKRKIILLIALIIGLGVPAAFIYVLDLYDNDINNRDDIKLLTIPFIGELPQMADKKRVKRRKQTRIQNSKLAVKEGLNDPLNEAFRSIRTNLSFMFQNSDKGHVIMISSLHPGSGKTFISMNLALSTALSESKSLVINADLRQGALSEYVGNPKNKGLSFLLRNKEERLKDNVVKGTLHPNVDVVPLGMIPPNPAELLMKPKFKELLDEARKEYDFIFIDCPPIDLITDTMIISKHVDTTLFVIRSKLADKRDLPYIDNLYSENSYPNMAVILNGVVEYNSKYGYGRRYAKYSRYR